MLSRFARIFLAVALLVALWGLSMARRPGSQVWVHPLDTEHPGPVRILRFYASVGSLTPGQTAQALLFRAERPARAHFPHPKCLARTGALLRRGARTYHALYAAGRRLRWHRRHPLLHSFGAEPARSAAVRASVCRAAQNHHPHPQPDQFIERRQQAPHAERTAIFRTALGSGARRFPPPRSPSFPACAPVPRRSCRWWR